MVATMEPSPSYSVTPLLSDDEPDLHHRAPPTNVEAEQALLGAILANNQAYERVADFLAADHFADPVHARIFEACGILIERGQIANAVQLKNLFEREEALEAVGGAQYLARLQASFVTIINAKDYGRTIHDLFLRRQLIDLGGDIVNEAHEHDLEADASGQIEVAEERLYKLAETGQTEGGLLPLKRAVVESVGMVEAAMRRDGQVAGVSSGLRDLDKLLGGLHRSDLIILAARPSMGKSTLATNIAFNIANSPREERDPEGNVIEMRQPVAFFSLEMSAEQLATRLISECSGVGSDSMRKGEIRNEEFDRIFEASRQLYEVPLFVDDTPALSVSALRTRARRMKRQFGLSLIVVDYLQLMQPPAGKRSENRVQEVSEITRGLKALAKDLDVPVLALSQLSRQVENREDKRPQLADLRESGSIEQDADVVMFIYREQYYLDRAEPMQRDDENAEKFHERSQRWQERRDNAENLSDVIVAKQRHGPIGTIKLFFNGATTTFQDYQDDGRLPAHY